MIFLKIVIALLKYILENIRKFRKLKRTTDGLDMTILVKYYFLKIFFIKNLNFFENSILKAYKNHNFVI